MHPVFLFCTDTFYNWNTKHLRNGWELSAWKPFYGKKVYLHSIYLLCIPLNSFFLTWNLHFNMGASQIREMIIMKKTKKIRQSLCLIKRFNSLRCVQHFDVHNFLEHRQHIEISWKIKEVNETNYEHKFNASKNEASKLLQFSFYLMHKIIMYVSQKILQIKHVYLSFNSLQWAPVSELIKHCCPLTLRAHVYQIRFTMKLIYRNRQVATITIDCIQLQQDICLLACEKWAYIGVLYIADKMREHRTWLKNLSYLTLSWF